jgi:hypothetical protein
MGTSDQEKSSYGPTTSYGSAVILEEIRHQLVNQNNTFVRRLTKK